MDNNKCESCGKIYTEIAIQWCKPCQINNFKKNFANWTSENEKIDDFIQEMQSKIDSYNDKIVEWISYDQFNEIKEIRKGDFATVYSAVWKDGPLYYNNKKIYGRDKYQNNTMKVTLKSLYNSQNINEFLNEVKSYSISMSNDNIKIHGISQHPDTKDYIIVLQDGYCENCGEIYTHIKEKWCKLCQINNFKKIFANWTSGNSEVDNFIQEMQLKINKQDDVIVEWIPYDQLSYIKEIYKGDNSATVYSAVRINGPLQFGRYNKEYIRFKDDAVRLKCLNDSENINGFLNEAKSYSIKKDDNNIKIYGISQNPDTKDYIMVLQDGFCEKCDEIYTDIENEWCKSCQINNFKKNFANWTSGNEKIDNFIQEMQSKIDSYNDTIVECISYDQFSEIKEIGKGGFAKVYSAVWKDGPLYYDKGKKIYGRNQNKKVEVALKCLYNSQNITNEFLNEVKKYSISGDDNGILKIYGISQDPDTKDYIMVLQYANCGNFNNYTSYINKNWPWDERLTILNNIIKGLKKIHENKMVHRNFHTGNILFSQITGYIYTISGNSPSNVYISDMGLCGKVGNIDETKIYGVMPYVAPEVLRGNSYTQAADIYSFGMIMYYVATGRQPFDTCAHNNILALNICNGIRPEINEQEVPKCYIDLIKKCWDSNPDNRSSAVKVEELIQLFLNSHDKFASGYKDGDKEIQKQFDDAEEYRRANYSSIENNKHSQAYYTSRLLNPFTKDLPKYDNINNTSVEVINFTELSIKNENESKQSEES